MTATDAASRPGISVLIVVDHGFPHGSGATSRTYSYAQGLLANGAKVRVLCVEPTDEAGSERPPRGVYRGIEYVYTYGRTARPDGRAERGLRKVAKWWSFCRAVLEWDNEIGGADAILLYSRSVPWAGAAKLGSLLIGAPLIHEDCELPFAWSRAGLRTQARRWVYERLACKWFDASLVISTFLRDYCADRLRPGAGILLVPILVDVDEVEPLAPEEEADDAVAFCGSLDHPEVRSLLESFAVVAGEFPGVTLRLIGGAKRATSQESLQRLAEDLGISGRLEMTGPVPREELYGYLRSARALLLPRPSGAFSRAGMPTKVGEYLATGRPVVVTANGDLPLYLEDGVDAYLVPPDDGAAFADRLRGLLSDPEKASAIGRRGRETARERFDAATHGARIISFIRDLQTARQRGRAGVTPCPTAPSDRRADE